MNAEQFGNKQRQIVATFVALAVVVLVVVGARAFVKTQQKQTASAASKTTTASNAATSASNSSSTGSSGAPTSTGSATSAASATASQSHIYKDGTYTVDARYGTPDGVQSIAVSLTIKNDVVSASSVQPEATGGDSAEYQAAFAEGYKPYVVGKSVDNIHLSRVSGSSLTTGGFNSALEQIKSQAKA